MEARLRVRPRPASPASRQVDVPGVVDGDGESAPGLVAVLVGGSVQHVVLALCQHLAGVAGDRSGKHKSFKLLFYLTDAL